MRKDFGKEAAVFPLPVFIIATYGENGRADAMNAAWGGKCGKTRIALNIGAGHMTTENIRRKKAFTVSFATKDTVVISDYFGVESGKNADKIAKSGVHVRKSAFVDASVIEEYPVTLECRLAELQELDGEARVVGEVVNMSADSTVLDENGKIDAGKLQPVSYDAVAKKYRLVGEIVGNAFSDGKALK
ncbi:MAG: flavin reductase family protein [Stomatobaculum sp.]|nr:flavin reductase family protein [Stomatobaculum sp.]